LVGTETSTALFVIVKAVPFFLITSITLGSAPAVIPANLLKSLELNKPSFEDVAKAISAPAP